MFNPDIIIVVGGGARPIYDSLDIKLDAVFINSARHGKKIRSNTVLRTILQYMPRLIQDRVRIFENMILTRNISVPQIDDEPLRGVHDKRVYVLDDTVDSGGTMKLISATLPATNHVRRGVVAVTSQRGYEAVDFAVYWNVIVRFPWKLF